MTNVGAAVPAEATAYGQIATLEENPTTEVQQLVVSNTEAEVREYFKDIPVMIEIAQCESHFRHTLADGSILQGRVDPADTGVMQINKRYHESTAVSLGFNLDNLTDNMAYARYLYETQGTQPWSASAPCWNRAIAMI